MKKLCARWLLRLLRVDQNLTLKTVSIEKFGAVQENHSEFLRQFKPLDETWIPHYTP